MEQYSNEEKNFNWLKNFSPKLDEKGDDGNPLFRNGEKSTFLTMIHAFDKLPKVKLSERVDLILDVLKEGKIDLWNNSYNLEIDDIRNTDFHDNKWTDIASEAMEELHQINQADPSFINRLNNNSRKNLPSKMMEQMRQAIIKEYDKRGEDI